MDTTMAVTRLEGAIRQQVVIAGGDPEVEAAAESILASLEPALRQMAYDLAEQAAAEVGAQLPAYVVDVVLSGGEPSLRVRSDETETQAAGDSMDARITLRLSPSLKEAIESAADTRGESVNSWLVRTLSIRAGEGRRRSRQVSGTIET